MSARSTTVIACDIGGVIRDQVTDAPIEDAVQALIRLSKDETNTVILISKCKEHYKQKSKLWLEEHNLSHLRALYCLEYGEKVKIAHDNQVNMMIDDRMQVLSTFPPSIIKIWFCSDPKKIQGARKFQPDFVNAVRIARDWTEVLQVIAEIKA